MVSLLALSVVGKRSRLAIGAQLLTERQVIGGKSEFLTVGLPVKSVSLAEKLNRSKDKRETESSPGAIHAGV
jgi:hypothetical protein